MTKSPVNKKNRPGMPDHEPTEEQRDSVAMLTVAGTPQHTIARIIGIDPKTLRKHYRDELDLAKARANAMVAQSLYQRAIGGDTAAAIWWSKAQLRWSERHEHTGEDGGPIKFTWVDPD